MRQIHVNENLSGQTLDASPDAHESLFWNCNLANTVFIGSWAGSDFFNCTGPIDARQADLYATYWVGNALAGSQWPTDIGFQQNVVIGAIIKDGLAQVANLAVRQSLLAVADAVVGGQSWNHSPRSGGIMLHLPYGTG